MIASAHPASPAVPFEPEQIGFARLRDYDIPPAVAVYEYQTHPAVDGRKDFLRLNIYMTKDGDFVTIWFGLLEPTFASSELELAGKSPLTSGFDFECYTEHLFRGRIATAETARYILDAIEIAKHPGYRKPQHLMPDMKGAFACEFVPGG